MLTKRTNGQACKICGGREWVHVFTKDGYELGRCSICDVVFVTNPPTSHALDQHYSFDKGYHSKFAEPDADLGPEIKMARRHLSELSRFKQAGRLLDIGCSAGIFLREARLVGWEVSGVERSPDTAEIGRQRFGLKIATGALHNDMFGDEVFDAITMWDVIEHLEDPLLALRTITRLLAADGVILMETPNITGLFPYLSYRVAGTLDYWPHPEPPGHLFQFSKHTISRLLGTAGLRPVYVGDRRIPLNYSFGAISDLLQSPKRLAYALAFAPSAMLGPIVGRGDSMIVAAMKI